VAGVFTGHNPESYISNIDYKIFNMRYFYCAALLWMISACGGKTGLVKESKVADFLNARHINAKKEKVEADLRFWQNKLQSDTGNNVFMLELARQYNHRFKVTGDVINVLQADSLFKQSNAKLANTSINLLFASAQQAITLHRFKDAERFNRLAAEKGAAPFTVNLLAFDSDMELGRYDSAASRLSVEKMPGIGFDYLIRRAKYEDHEGQLDRAIQLMETAYTQVEKQHNPGAVSWVLSNLGDMYGHAGRVKESRDAYVKVLAADSANLYVLKGLAWIAYSHDGNLALAEKITNFLLQQTAAPDIHLLMADIQESKGNEEAKTFQINQFVKKTTAKEYGGMYNKYLVDIFTVSPGTRALAQQLMQKEISNRATPETYSWLAYTCYKNGNLAMAQDILNREVLNKSYEPEVLLHSAEIMAAAGNHELAKKLYTACMESTFELGPLKTKQIKTALTQLATQAGAAKGQS
jgi:tetratricopeptide (TPR) repeat protein